MKIEFDMEDNNILYDVMDDMQVKSNIMSSMVDEQVNDQIKLWLEPVDTAFVNIIVVFMNRQENRYE